MRRGIQRTTKSGFQRGTRNVDLKRKDSDCVQSNRTATVRKTDDLVFKIFPRRHSVSRVRQ